MKKATYLRDQPHRKLAETEASIVIELDEPVEFLGITGPTESRFLAAIATRFPTHNRVSVYPCDAEGRALTIIPADEKKGTLSIREVMSEAGYDVSSWPEDVK